MSKIITVTEASRSFSDLINRVRYQGESTVLVKGGKPVAKIVPITENVTGKDLAELWPKLPHLAADEAIRLETDLSDARSSLLQAKDKWA